MDKFTLVFRGGCPKGIGESIEEILGETGLQDTVFITDVKSHSVDMLAIAEVRPLINRLQGKYGLSIIHTGNQYQIGVTICFGKLQDSAVVKTMQNQATGLFK